LDRGRIAERWHSERWDSLKLLTPRRLSRLPGHTYDGPEPDGYMSRLEVIEFLERYAARSAAPIQAGTRVLRVSAHDAGYRVDTDRGAFSAAHVVLATGYCDLPAFPKAAAELHVQQVAPNSYRSPSSLAPGGVLVVGAAASGVQIADELARSGRSVTLAVGRHTRLPRRYRGADIMHWLDRIGALDETTTSVHDLPASRAQPSLQLIGSEPPRDLDLATLARDGVRICGRVTGASRTRVCFADDLAHSLRAADAKLRRTLQRIDSFIADSPGLGAEPQAYPQPIDPSGMHSSAVLDLAAEGISTVLWATGFVRDYRWLRVPVLDARGELLHTRGITPAQGLYALGLRFQHTRKSSFIDGVGADADYLARHIAARLGIRESAAA
jgi:putative flavoprotein involved in K+ transport